MAQFDRFDICAAHLALEWNYHVGGILQERASNKRRNMSTDYQLRRMGFTPGAAFNGKKSLSANGKEIYRNLEVRYGLRVNKFKLYKTAKVRGTKNSFVALLSFDEKTHTYQTRMGSVYGTYHVTELKSYCL